MDPEISSELPQASAPERKAGMVPDGPYCARPPEAQGVAAAEQGNMQPQGSTQVGAPPSRVVADSSADNSSTSQMQQPMSSMPAVADDTDLIEKEWVLKAKAIVARTRTDPYKQNQAINHVKADYMKKRYNKDIKVSEG